MTTKEPKQPAMVASTGHMGNVRLTLVDVTTVAFLRRFDQLGAVKWDAELPHSVPGKEPNGFV